MEKPRSNYSSTTLVYVFGAVMFALLSILASRLTFSSTRMSNILYRIDLTWVFWLMILCSVSLLVLPIVRVLRSLHDRKTLPRFLDVFFQEPFQNWLARSTAMMRAKATGFAGHLAIVGAGIFLIIAIISNTYLVRDREMGTYLNEFASDMLGTRPSQSVTPSVLQFSLFTSSSNATDYLKYCIKIVKQLESAGVKAVLVDIRGTSNFKGGAEYQLIEELTKSKNVVLGIDSYWLFHETSFSRGTFTFRPFESYLSPALSRIQPDGEAFRYPGVPLDVSLELLRKYRDYPSTLMPKREGSTLVFGDFRMPVTKDGWMYSRVIDDYRFMALGAQVGIKSDTLMYNYRGTSYASLEGLKNQLSDKILLILWDGHQAQWARLDDYFTLRAYATSLDNILRGILVRKIEWSPLWLVILCLGVSVFIAYKLRPLVSVLAIFLFGFLVLVLDSFLYSRMGVLFEIVYPLLAVLMSMVLLPAIAFIHRLGEN
jgi:hypothetical protein